MCRRRFSHVMAAIATTAIPACPATDRSTIEKDDHSLSNWEKPVQIRVRDASFWSLWWGLQKNCSTDTSTHNKRHENVKYKQQRRCACVIAIHTIATGAARIPTHGIAVGNHDSRLGLVGRLDALYQKVGLHAVHHEQDCVQSAWHSRSSRGPAMIIDK
jgi:hypothetical protein